MVWSNYNLLFESKKYGFLLYNSLSNCFLQIEQDLYNEIKKNSNDKQYVFEEEIQKIFIDNKILVDNDYDEFINLKLQTHYQRYNNKFFSYTLVPTTECNFNCDYCFEDKKNPKYLTDEVENKIVSFIKDNNDCKHVNITWMGGEPLLAFDRMKSITAKLKANEISVEAAIISNGYLLTEEIINDLAILNINRIQVTIDGLCDTHNKRRKHNDIADTFTPIFNNIINLLEKRPDILLNIRVNVDDTNINEFDEIYNFLRNNVKGNFNISPGYIQNIENCKEECSINRNQKANFLKEQFKNNSKSISIYPLDNVSECAIRNINCYIIGPVGELYKCWNHIGNEEKIIGDIFKSRKVNHTLLARYLSAADPLDDIKCQKCFLFPVCKGGCPDDRINVLYNNYDFDFCNILNGNIKEFLELHYENKLINEQTAEKFMES